MSARPPARPAPRLVHLLGWRPRLPFSRRVSRLRCLALASPPPCAAIPATSPACTAKPRARVAAYTGDNAFYRHGDLRVSANHRSSHADGTPFLWLGDTAWNATWKSTAAHEQDVIRARVSALCPPHRDHRHGRAQQHEKPARRPRAFPRRRHAQCPFLARPRREARLRQRPRPPPVSRPPGRVSGSSPSGFGTSSAHPPCAHALRRQPLRRAYGRVLAQHGSALERLKRRDRHPPPRALTTRPSSPSIQEPTTETIKRYHDAPYADFTGLQSGHRSGNVALTYQGAREWTLELWQRPPGGARHQSRSDV